MSERPETLEQFYARSLREALATRAAGLRRIADDFDQLAGQVGKTAQYSQVAYNATHELAWGLANLGMERLIDEAAGADLAKSKGE